MDGRTLEAGRPTAYAAGGNSTQRREPLVSFQQFTFPQVEQALGLTLAEADLFSQVAPTPVRPEFLAQVVEGANLASAINTEKARSEFVIAPVLFELRRLHPGKFGLFSGVELDADAARGLNGVCDFVLTRSPLQHVLTTPLVTIVGAKNDNLQTGLGQVHRRDGRRPAAEAGKPHARPRCLRCGDDRQYVEVPAAARVAGGAGPGRVPHR
jgi:hypothetical protein